MKLFKNHRAYAEYTVVTVSFVFLVFLIKHSEAIPANVYKCCPNGSELTVSLDRDENILFDCSNVGNSSNTLISVNIIREPLGRMPMCPNRKLVELTINDDSVSFGGCIDMLNGVVHHLYCPDRFTVKVEQAFKCCPQNYIFDIVERECVPTNKQIDQQDLNNVFQNKISVLLPHVPICDDDRVFVEYHVNSDQLILKNGAIQIRLSTNNEEYLSAGSFCLDETVDQHFNQSVTTQLIVKGCTLKTVCNRIPCVRKCCKSHQIIERLNGTAVCVNFEKNFRPTYYDVQLPLDINATQNEVHKLEYGFLEKQSCVRFALSDDNPDETHFLSHIDGSLHIYNSKDSIDNNDYCMEYYNGETLELMTFVCFPQTDPQRKFQYYAIGLTISCVFLSVTLIVYASLPKFLNLHGKTVMSYVVSLLAAYISLATVQYHRQKLNYCYTVAVLIYFFFLAAFCWQSIMCFDIWWTFGSVRVSRGMRKNKEMRRFLLYSLYAWGIPTLFTALVSLVDVYQLMPSEWNPEFASNACWFGEQKWRAHLIFFLIPIGLHTVCNAILFTLTAIHCNKVKNEIHRMQRSNDNDTHKIKKRFLADKTKYVMNIKLFIVMGVSWMLEIFATLFPQWNVIWYFSDAFNVFQGVLVFIIFVFKPKVWVSFQQKLGMKTKSVRGGTTTLGTATSFLTNSKENLNTRKTNKFGKSSSYSTLASSSVNLNNMLKPA